VLVFVMGAFAEMSEDASRICGIITPQNWLLCHMGLY